VWQNRSYNEIENIFGRDVRVRIRRVSISNFRGIKNASLELDRNNVLVGDTNIGKTNILEALDLVLGPDRIHRRPPIDEHDFYCGVYEFSEGENLEPTKEGPTAAGELSQGEDFEVADDLASMILRDGAPCYDIQIEVTLTELSDEYSRRFGEQIEWWDSVSSQIYQEPNPEGIDGDNISPAIRVTFVGKYDEEEDDFTAHTYFARSYEAGSPERFTKKHKQFCGFLYLRTIRTGSRALSLERGSLLDIILRLKEIRPQMWKKALFDVSGVAVAETDEVSQVLSEVERAVKKFVPREWGDQPHLKITNLTRNDLRKVIMPFISTGENGHAAPYYRQGSGTLNMLVLSLLSIIAEMKQNVIFAMEEPEIGVPPYTQKRVVQELRHLCDQTIFTSHSTYVLEQFEIEETIVLAKESGTVSRCEINLPSGIKLKRYKKEYREGFVEGLLGRRLFFVEGESELAIMNSLPSYLSKLDSEQYSSLERLGITIINAGSDSKLLPLVKLYKSLGKITYTLCDAQEQERSDLLNQESDIHFEHNESGIEKLVMNNTTDTALLRFAQNIDFPQHIVDRFPDIASEYKPALEKYFNDGKGQGVLADYLLSCEVDEIPEWIKAVCRALKDAVEPPQQNEELGRIEE